jgi:hypothetical protein
MRKKCGSASLLRICMDEGNPRPCGKSESSIEPGFPFDPPKVVARDKHGKSTAFQLLLNMV